MHTLEFVAKKKRILLQLILMLGQLGRLNTNKLILQ